MKTDTRLSLIIEAFIVMVVFSMPGFVFGFGRNLTAAESALVVQFGIVTADFGLSVCEPNEIIVKFGEDVSEEDRNAVVRQYGCEVINSCASGDFQLVRIPESETTEEMIDTFEKVQAVEYAELNYYTRISLVPNDTYYSFQWDLDNPVNGGINMEAAWDIQIGDPNVIIAVLDTGVAYEDYDIYKQAPDLAETFFVAGYDFVNDDEHPNDDHGHGTHVTGTIAQSSNNDMGVAGIAFGCSIMPVKVMDRTGVGNHFDIARGIYFAANNLAKVVNMSFGNGRASNTLRNAVAYAYRRGVTVVCAAGNEFLDDNAVTYPAAYDDYCIAVGATRYDQTRAYYSNTGDYIDIVAPGGDVLADQNGDGYPDGVLQQTFSLEPDSFSYWFFQGTSMAAPHVSGAAALIISNGQDNPDKVREAIEMTTKDAGPVGWDPEYGWGLLDVWSALNYQMEADSN